MINIISVSGIDFDKDGGEASDIRTKFINKGLKTGNTSVKVYSYKANYCTNTSFEGWYIFKKKKNLSSFLSKIIFVFKKNWHFFSFLMKFKKDDVILIDKMPIILIYPFLLFKIFRKNYVIAQFSEFLVYHTTPKGKIEKILGSFYFFSLKLLLKKVDLLLVISKEHKSYYKSLVKKECDFFILPFLIDIDKTVSTDTDINPMFKVCYAGALSKSNGVEFLIDSFINVENAELEIFGPSIDGYEKYLVDKVDFLGISQKVFIGKAKENEETIRLLANKDLLVIPKLDDFRAKGYIPSKLGDFLFSGTPVLVTDVGEMNEYVVDGVNGYIIKTEDPIEFGKKINSIIKSQDTIKSIGIEGKKMAFKFHYQNQMDSFLLFLKGKLNE